MKTMTVSKAQLSHLTVEATNSIHDQFATDMLMGRVDRKDSRRKKRERDQINRRRKSSQRDFD